MLLLNPQKYTHSLFFFIIKKINVNNIDISIAILMVNIKVNKLIYLFFLKKKSSEGKNNFRKKKKNLFFFSFFLLDKTLNNKNVNLTLLITQLLL